MWPFIIVSTIFTSILVGGTVFVWRRQAVSQIALSVLGGLSWGLTWYYIVMFFTVTIEGWQITPGLESLPNSFAGWSLNVFGMIQKAMRATPFRRMPTAFLCALPLLLLAFWLAFRARDARLLLLYSILNIGYFWLLFVADGRSFYNYDYVTGSVFRFFLILAGYFLLIGLYLFFSKRHTRLFSFKKIGRRFTLINAD